ncbi:ead/Ea22-like family protein [Klebsiella quasipneumoniae]|uniref:ead/Ea22-like family protein n=1 Tax=Klebsiella quasipneumoniae TaxID=1463165 RepID=UPI002DBC12E1|nr:ead/Ea22-like family protein [Klebsiella quasipneumoniae]MEB6481815.1 ead/Ea22-like family protein [Klebsiella quasipneumoniae]
MTTDITELAQRMKAAAVRAKTATEEYASGHMSVSVCYAECEEFNRLTDGPDNILALVEALESEKRICATWRKTAEANSEKLEKAQTINAAAEKLVRCKGRYHSEQNYRALAALFGVNTPDLPPLEHENVHYADAAEMEIAALRQRIAELESRTVTVKLPQRLQPGADGWDDWYVHSDDEGEYLKFDDVLAMLTAAGIKVEAE